MNRFCVNCMEPLGEGEVCQSCGFCQSDYHAEAHQLAPGVLLRDRYEIGRVLGEGGFGITYVGKDTVLERKVAVKEFYMSGYVNRNCTVSTDVLSSAGTQGETFEKNKEKFLTEARVLAKFDDEGIVNIRDFFQENNTAYIVMDFLSGETLRDYIKRIGKLTTEEIVSILEPVLRALTNVHAHDLIHRDISPDNIMLTDDGKVKLLDFGAAREVSKADAKSLSIILKPGYAPEEQYRSRGRQGPWTDIYALCATMYRCITGIVPDDAMERIFTDEVVPPAQLDCDCSPAMSRVIMKGLSVRGVDRFQSVPELWDAICMAEENPDYIPPVDPDDERTVYSGPAAMPRQEEEATVYAGASADPDATVYSGHAQPKRSAEPAAPRKTAAPTAARSERFQRQTTTTSRRPAAPAPKAQPQPEVQPEPVQPVKKKRKAPLIIGIVAGVLAVAGLGFFLGKGGLKDQQSPAQTQQYQQVLPDLDRSEISERMGGAIDLVSDEISISLPVKVDEMTARGYSLTTLDGAALPQVLAARETCEAVLVSPEGIPGKIIYTLENFLTEPAELEKCVITGLSSGGPKEQKGLSVACETPSGVLQITEDSDYSALETVAAELGLGWEETSQGSTWRVYLTPERDGAYLELGFDGDGRLTYLHIDTGLAVEEYYEAHPPVQQPVTQYPAGQTTVGGSVVTGMSYRREALVEQMGGEMELYWNGKTLRLPATVQEFKEQGFNLDSWAGSEAYTTIDAGIQKTAMLDNEYGDSGYMYVGVHNYTSTEQPVDGCWIADVEIFGVPNYKDLQLNWWTPGGQFFIHSGMTSDEIRQEAANNNVCVLPDDAVNSDWPEDMMLSVAEDGSLVQLVLFFDENGTLCDMAILMHHVYERYFEMYPEEAVPITVAASSAAASYDRRLMVDYLVGDVRLTWDEGVCALPMTFGEFKAQGYPVSEWQGISGGDPVAIAPGTWMTACTWKDNNPLNNGNGNVDLCVRNYSDVNLAPEDCIITNIGIWDIHGMDNMCLTWNSPNGEFKITNDMTEADIVDQAKQLNLRIIEDAVSGSEHITKSFMCAEVDSIEIVTFFEHDGSFHGIHVLADSRMDQYFADHPDHALPAKNGPDYRVEEVRADMGIEIKAAWDGYNITLPMPVADYLAQGNQMQSMKFSEYAAPFEGFNAIFQNSAGMETSMMYWISNFTNADLLQDHCLITEVQTSIERSTENLVFTVKFPTGTMTLAAGMTEEQVDAEMERFGLVYTTFPNESVKKMELLSTEGRAFIDIDFDENGIVKYLRACVDTYCAEYYSIHGLS